MFLLIQATVFLFGLHDASTHRISVDGVEREFILYPPSKPRSENGAPVLLVFHGHGGTARNIARRTKMHDLWPEAIVIYPQGLSGVAGITDPEGKKTGWQKTPGSLDDRDVHFFDALMTSVKTQFKVNDKQVFLMGHSNGSMFVYVLWSQRGEQIAAVCTACAQNGLLIQKAPRRSCFAIAGENDPIVPFKNQVQQLDRVKQCLRIADTIKEDRKYLTRQTTADGLELVTYLHPGGHELPQVILPDVVAFFKRQMPPK